MDHLPEKPLCNQIASPDTVDVSRLNAFPRNPPRTFSSPLYRAVAAVDDVRRLYAVTCSLQQVESGRVHHCPLDIGVTYRFVFLEGKHEILRVSVDASGCQWLKGEDPYPTTAYWTDDRFWNALGAALQLEPDDPHVPSANSPQRAQLYCNWRPCQHTQVQPNPPLILAANRCTPAGSAQVSEVSVLASPYGISTDT